MSGEGDEAFMHGALAEAAAAERAREGPVGAVVVADGAIVGCGVKCGVAGCLSSQPSP